MDKKDRIRACILIVDDEKSIRITLREFLKDADYEVSVAEDVDEALGMMAAVDFDVVVTDIILPRVTGVGLLKAIKETSPHVQVILITGEPTVETASEAVRVGAADYLAKPIGKEPLLRSVANAVKVKFLEDERRCLVEENLQYQENLEMLVEERTADLHESEERWQFALEGSRDGVWDWNIVTNEVFITNRWKEILGFEKDEIDNTQDEWNKRFHPDDRALYFANLNRHLKGETQFYENEYRMLCKDGSYKWILDRGKIVSWGEDKKPQRMIGTHTDITERKSAEEELIKTKHDIERLLSAAGEGIYGVDTDGLMTFINPAATQMLGWSSEELIGQLLHNIIHHTKPDESPYPVKDCHIYMAFKDGKIHRINDEVFWRKDGSSFPITYVSTPIKEQGELVGAVVVFTDITERKQAEKEIRRFSRIFEDSLNEIYLFDVDSLKFVQANNAALHNLGYTLEELQELTPVDIKPEFTAELFAKLLVPLRKGKKENIVFETIHQCKDKSLYDVEVHLQLLRHEDKALFVAIIMDITEKKKQEAILHQAQKMEAIGQLTGGIAHDFNNLLSIISGNLRFLKEDLGETSEDIDELFEDAMSAVDDGAELTQRLLGFSRTKILQPETRNVNDTIDKFVRFLSRSLADNTELVPVLPDENLFISVDTSQLENALLNLSLNARDAMPKGGTITISAKRSHEIDGDSSLSEGNYIIISITDTGVGISPEDMQHVYEPFFTTKEVGKGSGLGLSMVYGFTQQSQGACHIDSIPGEGTTVSMYFPEVLEQRDMDQTPKDDEDLSLRGSEVILVVEDDPRVRRVTLRNLKKLGYQTLEADNAAMARTIIESGEPIDLLFSDILMLGEMDGHMLALWTEEHYPHIKIILTTGFRKGKIDMREDKKHLFPLLRKPYSVEKLARQIRETLEE